MTTISVFTPEAPIREYGTKKAAEKFAKRLVKGGYVKKAAVSFFGFNFKTTYQVYEGSLTALTESADDVLAPVRL